MEKLFHYIWKFKLLPRDCRLVDGRRIVVLNPGRYNQNSGPDFSNAQIKIEDCLWSGNVEIHVKASDWNRHGHSSDPAYDSVLLHVVGEDDIRIITRSGRELPQMAITIPRELYLTYNQLDNQLSGIRCQNRLSSLSSLAISDWLETLSIERLQSKAMHVKETLDYFSGDWQQTCFTILARSLGFGLNGEPFEQLARNLPLKIPSHHSDDITQLEALMFGQAGMLDKNLYPLDDYYQYLCREYIFLARKYGLQPLPAGVWKYSRTRPQNFPHRRIALLAALCKNGFNLFNSFITSIADLERLKNLFDAELSPYWATHSSFGVESYGNYSRASLSRSSIEGLIINCVVPICYTFGAITGDVELSERADNLLSTLSPEHNSITRHWSSLGLKSEDARRSQALIHLRRQYCDAKRCFSCRFGYQLLKADSPQLTTQ